jgi:hypothetical protein
MDLDTTGRQLTNSPERPRGARGAAIVASRPRDAEVEHLIVARGNVRLGPYTRPTPTRIPHDTADTGCIVMRQPRIRRNDYTALDVIPAYGHQDKLDLVLAGLVRGRTPTT